MTDDEFLIHCENQTYPFSQWNHRAHVKLAYLYLIRDGFESAVEKLRGGITAYNASNNIIDQPTSGYHETMTQFWLQIIDVTVREYGAMPSADEFVDSHPQLSQKKNHRLFYSAELFMLPLAKRQFVEPDLTALPKSIKSPNEM
jgi:hypothetical protein